MEEDSIVMEVYSWALHSAVMHMEFGNTAVRM